jgi:hypothetical protein
VNNTFIGAHLDAGYEGFARYLSNTFVGPGDFGLRCYAGQGGVTVQGNTVSGKVDGIIVHHPLSPYVADNEVTDCSGSAFRSYRTGTYPDYSAQFHGNRVRNCGAHGFDLDEVMGNFTENVVESVGGDGIRALNALNYSIRRNQIRNVDGHGIRATYVVHSVNGNLVLDTGSEGISLYTYETSSCTVLFICEMAIDSLKTSSPSLKISSWISVLGSSG